MYSIKFDDDGLIVQTNGDGGDCASRTGEYYTGLGCQLLSQQIPKDWPRCSLKDWYDALKKLTDSSGNVLRYTKAPYNNAYDKEWGASRDQTMPIVVASAFLGSGEFSVSKLWSNIKGNDMCFPNGDICGPQDIAVIFRACMWPSLLYYIFDLQLVGAVLLRCWQARNTNNVGDSINLTLYLVLSNYRYPTMFSRLAIWLFGKLCPGGVQRQFDWYHRPETGSNPLNELWRPIIKKFFGY